MGPEDWAWFNSIWRDYCSDNRIVVEFVRETPTVNSFLYRGMRHRQVRQNVYVDIQTAHQCWEEIRPTARTGIRKARRKGLRGRLIHPVRELGAFEHLYLRTAERLQMGSFYLFDSAYFAALTKWLSADMIQLEVECGTDLVASSLCFLNADQVVYYLGAWDPVYQGCRPTDMLYWQMILATEALGKRTLSLGGGTTNDPDDALFRFKMKYGNRTEPVFISYAVHNEHIYKLLRKQWEAACSSASASKAHYVLFYRE